MRILHLIKDRFSWSDEDKFQCYNGFKKLREKYEVRAEDVATSFAIISIVSVVVKGLLVGRSVKGFSLNKSTLFFLDTSSVQIDGFSLIPLVVIFSLAFGLVALGVYESVFCRIKVDNVDKYLNAIILISPVFAYFSIVNLLDIKDSSGIFALCAAIVIAIFVLSLKANFVLRYALVSSLIMFCLSVWLSSSVSDKNEWSEEKN